MNIKKKAVAKKVSKNRLLCITLPESLLASSKAYRRKNGFSSMSELLRATIEHAPRVALKKNKQEIKSQVSFRLSDALYSTLSRVANQSGQSTARIIRMLLEDAQKLGLRGMGSPAVKKKPAAKNVQNKKTVSAKKRPTTKNVVAATKEKPSKRKISRKR